jgi:hypothetical protein
LEPFLNPNRNRNPRGFGFGIRGINPNRRGFGFGFGIKRVNPKPKGFGLGFGIRGKNPKPRGLGLGLGPVSGAATRSNTRTPSSRSRSIESGSKNTASDPTPQLPRDRYRNLSDPKREAKKPSATPLKSHYLIGGQKIGLN